MSSKNPQYNGAAALSVERGSITCGSKERRRLYEELGIEDKVDEWTGEAKKAGRQAQEGNHIQEESDDESPVEGPRSEVNEEVREIVERAQESSQEDGVVNKLTTRSPTGGA